MTLHLIVVCVISDTRRHAGHADIVRELFDDPSGIRKARTACRQGIRHAGGRRSRPQRAAREARQLIARLPTAG
ncbi:DUF664 domain-containing protein [Streptomyces griseorubiginosus]|uniref:mycothiol transferase n=1 Tax=Streptomyces griseorubiginosus TaxID=67304 RepID=UPI0033BED0FB